MKSNNTRKFDYLFWGIGILVIVAAIYYEPTTQSQPTFAVLNESEVVQSRLDQGDTSAQALVYYQTLVRLYAANNVTVFSESSMISYPSSMEVSLPTPNSLYTSAAQNGIVITDDDIERAQAEINAQQRKIMDAIMFRQNQTN